MALNFLQLRNLITAYLTPSSEVDKVTASELRAVENAVVDRMESDLSYQGTVNNAFVEALEAVASGSPKGSYANEAALKSADPDHTYTYVTTDTGKWYYWDTVLEDWEIGGDYQAPLDIVGELGTSESKVINQKKVTELTSLHAYNDKQKEDIDLYLSAYYTKLDGTLQSNVNNLSLIKFPINPLNKYYIGGVMGLSINYYTNVAFIALYDSDDNLIKAVSSTDAYALAATLGVQVNGDFSYNNTLLTDWLEGPIPSNAATLSVVNMSESQWPVNNFRMHSEEYISTTLKDYTIQLKAKQELYTGLLHVVDMFITESFVPVNVSYTDGIVVSPVNVVWADGATGNIRIVSRDSLNNITQCVANHILNGVTTILTMTITRDTNGNTTNVTIT